MVEIISKMVRRCEATTNAGRRCKMIDVEEGKRFCRIHASREAEVNPIVEDDEINQDDDMVVNEVESVSDNTVNTTIQTANTLNTVHVREIEEMISKVTFATATELQLRDQQIKLLMDQVELLKQQLAKRPSNRSPEYKAKSDYYKQNKKNPSIIEEIKKRLQTVNMYVPEKPVPWQLVRAATDSMYDKLAPEEKARLIALQM